MFTLDIWIHMKKGENEKWKNGAHKNGKMINQTDFTKPKSIRFLEADIMRKNIYV